MAFTINFIVEGAIWRNARKCIEYVFVVDDEEVAKQVLPFYRRKVRVKLLGVEFVGTISRGRHGVGFSIFLPRRYAGLWEAVGIDINKKYCEIARERLIREAKANMLSLV